MRRQIAQHEGQIRGRDADISASPIELQILRSQVHTMRTAIPGEPVITVVEHERILGTRLQGTRVAHAMEATEALRIQKSECDDCHARLAHANRELRRLEPLLATCQARVLEGEALVPPGPS